MSLASLRKSKFTKPILFTYFFTGVTVTGSLIAYGKLQGSLSSAATLLPGRHALNAGLLGANAAAMGYFLYSPDFMSGLGMLGTTTSLSALMGKDLIKVCS